MFISDFVLNGQGHGEVFGGLEAVRFDTGLLRPYYDKNRRKCVTVNTGQHYDPKLGLYVPTYEKKTLSELRNMDIESPVFNATALRKDEWILLDRLVLKAARERLRAWGDLAGANTYGGFNGMSKTILEHETMSDPGVAVVDMDGLTEGRNDAQQYQLEGLPLPITHVDFHFPSRKLAISRNGGTPIDMVMIEAAGRRVAEMVERTLIGVETGITYGAAADYGRAPTVYGYTNFPNRITFTGLVTPDGTNAAAVIDAVLNMRQQLYAAKRYGPFMLYHSNDWDRFMDDDYILTGGNVTTSTLRERLKAIEGISDVRRLDFFPGNVAAFQLLLVQMTSDIARAVVGMDITTVQWESQGGMRLNFKVMAIMVPQLRADFNGSCGILHATT